MDPDEEVSNNNNKHGEDLAQALVQPPSGTRGNDNVGLAHAKQRVLVDNWVHIAWLLYEWLKGTLLPEKDECDCLDRRRLDVEMERFLISDCGKCLRRKRPRRAIYKGT